MQLNFPQLSQYFLFGVLNMEEEGKPNVESLLTTLLELGPDHCDLHGNAGGLKLDDVKRIAKHLGIPISQPKALLFKCIFKKHDNKRKLEEDINNDAVSSYGSTFRKNKNTFSRLANFLFQNPDRLVASKLISTRNDLQNRHYNEKNPLYLEAVQNFNDFTKASDGLIEEHPALVDREIDPEEENLSGDMTVKYAYQLLRDVVNTYASTRKKWEASGSHNPNFWDYCNNDIDVFYLHLWLSRLGDPQLERFCSEGNELPVYLDSGEGLCSPDISLNGNSHETPSTSSSSGGVHQEEKGKHGTSAISLLKANMAERKVSRLALTQALESLRAPDENLNRFRLFREITAELREMVKDGVSEEDEFFQHMKRNKREAFDAYELGMLRESKVVREPAISETDDN